ncbi:endodeoxyribonuclease, partial [Escherichia coli]|nr:endodeoxyribonuclease [Escherichia coli]
MSLEVGEYIPGYEGKYSVTKDGRVYSHLRGRFLNPSPDNKGYLRVTLCSD